MAKTATHQKKMSRQFGLMPPIIDATADAIDQQVTQEGYGDDTIEFDDELLGLITACERCAD